MFTANQLRRMLFLFVLMACCAAVVAAGSASAQDQSDRTGNVQGGRFDRFGGIPTVRSKATGFFRVDGTTAT